MPVSEQCKMILKEMRSRRVHGDPKAHSAVQLLLSEEERNLSLPVEESFHDWQERKIIL